MFLTCLDTDWAPRRTPSTTATASSSQPPEMITSSQPMTSFWFAAKSRATISTRTMTPKVMPPPFIVQFSP